LYERYARSYRETDDSVGYSCLAATCIGKLRKGLGRNEVRIGAVSNEMKPEVIKSQCAVRAAAVSSYAGQPYFVVVCQRPLFQTKSLWHKKNAFCSGCPI
jgi:hypothetical protein